MSEAPSKTSTTGNTASASSKKRKYGGGGGDSRNNNNNNNKNDARKKWKSFRGRPNRGAPGMLLTCETGRERKCQREALEILNHYHFEENGNNQTGDTNKDDKTDATDAMGLDDELALLRSNTKDSSAFACYETSCRGTVFLLCTLPGCHLIPAIQTEYKLTKQNEKQQQQQQQQKDNAESSSSKGGETPTTKEEPKEEPKGSSDKTTGSSKETTTETESSAEIPLEDRAAETTKTNEAPSATESAPDDPASVAPEPKAAPSPPWDPVASIKAIMADIDEDSNREAPRSRFVTRMIPIQATCFASPEEVGLACKELLARYFPKKAETFAISFKRRNCSNLDRKKTIETIGDLVAENAPECRVNLGKPDATIFVEICGTLCGLSVVEHAKDYRRFNLLGGGQ